MPASLHGMLFAGTKSTQRALDNRLQPLRVSPGVKTGGLGRRGVVDVVHRANCVVDAGHESVGRPKKTPPASCGTRRLSEARVEARRIAAVRLQAAIDGAGTSRAAVAAALGVSSTTVDGWCNPEHPSSPADGDIDAMPSRVREAYAELRRAELRRSGTFPVLGVEVRHRRVVARTGRLSMLVDEQAPAGFEGAGCRSLLPAIQNTRVELDALETELRALIERP